MKRIILGLLLALWATIAAAQFPQDYYWQVGDTNPTTQVFSSKRGIYVVTSDATYVAWLAAGNIVGYVATDATVHVVINGINQSLGSVQYGSYSSAGNITLSTVSSGGSNPIATTMLLAPASGGNVFLPPASAIGVPATGKIFTIYNNAGGLTQFNIKNNDGSQTPGNMLANTSRVDCLLYDNTTLQGGWFCKSIITQGDDIDNFAAWKGSKIGLAYGGTNADLSATGGASQFLRQNSSGANVDVVRPACSALSDSTAGCSDAIATNSQVWSATAAKIVEANVLNSAGNPVALTDAATVAVDMATGINFTVTLAGNRTLGAPSNTQTGRTGCIFITQDGTGTRTLAYNAVWKFPGGTAPVLTTTAAAVDDLCYVVVDSTHIHAMLNKDFK